MNSDKATALLGLARDIASSNDSFHAVRGPGVGGRVTLLFMRELRERAIVTFGSDFSERKLCGETLLAVDFYFPDEATIVEVALGLPNPASEFEKDILKAIMAKECGYSVHRLFFISRPGAVKKCGQPGRAAFRQWAREKHRIFVEVHELLGESRPRRRRARKQEALEPVDGRSIE